MKILTLSLLMTVSAYSALAYYDNDLSIAEVCQDQYNRQFPQGNSAVFFDVAGEEEFRHDYFGNEYWYLSNDDAVCFVTLKENGSIALVQVEIGD